MTVSPELAAFENAATLILEDLRERVGLKSWNVSRRDGDEQVVLAAVDNRMNFAAGQVRSWADSICSLVLEGTVPMCIPDTAQVPALAKFVTEIGACATVPVTAPDGWCWARCAASTSTSVRTCRRSWR